jgi:hypothetical protein
MIITSNDTLTKTPAKFQRRKKVIKNCEQNLAKNIENKEISGEYYFIFLLILNKSSFLRNKY